MRLSSTCVVALLAAWSGCANEEDPWPPRPANGGPGGSTDPVDAGESDVDGGVIEDELLGRVCVVGDFQTPLACPDIPLGRGVQVKDVPTVNTVLSDNATLFTIPATTATVVLEVGGVAGDGLHPTLSVVSNDGGTEDVAVFDQALWDAMLGNLVETEVAGALVIYVVGPTGAPVADATVTHATPAVGQRLYYDDGVGGWDSNATTTGPDGIALILDSISGEVEATATGFTAGSADLQTHDGAAGIGVIRLTAAP